MKKTRLPIQHCANYRNGKCDGIMIRMSYETGKLTSWIEKELVGKPCVVIEGKKCLYFDNVVVPGISGDQQTVRR